MSNQASEILRVENLHYCYGKVEVWRDLNLSLQEGKTSFLVGHNGSGKSTLLRCLAGMGSPTQGRVYLQGKQFLGTSRKERSRIAFVPDMPSFYDDLTAEEHIRFMMRVNRQEGEYARAERLLEEFDLARFTQQYPSTFSRGMREKLALVIALLTKAQLYLLDEPYGPLDNDASKLLSAKLQACTAEGATVLLSCHHAVPGLVPDKVFLLEDETLFHKDESYLQELWGFDLAQEQSL